MMQETVEKLWPLSTNFEYAAEVGLALRMICPSWWDQFAQRGELGALPQGQGLQFLNWIEQNDQLDYQEKIRWINAALAQCGSKVLLETEAELISRQRDLTERADPDPVPLLEGEEVNFYAPDACRGYPNGQTDWLDQWTEVALEGSTIINQDSEPVGLDQICRVHYPDYVRGIIKEAENGGTVLTPETIITAAAPEAIKAAAGALVAASEAAREDPTGLYICSVRPGSHHAGKSSASGTCLINNLAVAAQFALEKDISPVAILDVDAHHGNGTQQIFRDQKDVLTISLQQQMPFFPSTSHDHERGYGWESNLSIDINPSDDWRVHLERALITLERFHPKLVLVELSADAHRADAVSELQASDSDFFYLGQELRRLGRPTVFELGASLSERAWIGMLRSVIRGWQNKAER